MNLELLTQLIGPFIGALTGVVSGFFVNHWYQKRRDMEIKSEYLSVFRDQNQESMMILQKMMGNLTPIDHWMSAVNSGDLRVFTPDERKKLIRTYFVVQCYNYEAEKARDVRDKWRAAPELLSKTFSYLAWKKAELSTNKIGSDALTKLQELAKEEWFKDP